MEKELVLRDFSLCTSSFGNYKPHFNQMNYYSLISLPGIIFPLMSMVPGLKASS